MEGSRYAGQNDHAQAEEPIDVAIAELARRQGGYVKRQQLIALGLSRQAIHRRVKTGRLIPVYAGVYAVGHVPTLPQDRAVGALLACGENAVLSHGTAATAWGIFKHWTTPFEVTAPTIRCRRGIEVHRALLKRQDVTRQLGLRVTSPARTLLDVSPRLTDRELTRAVNDLRRAGILHLEQLEDVLTRFPRHPGARRLRRFLDPPDGNPTRSPLEDDFVAFAERYGLPRPQVNVRVAGREVDAWFPEERVIVEIDGWDFHSDRHSFESDRVNDAIALELEIPTIRLTKARMRESPEEEAARVLRILATRRGK